MSGRKQRSKPKNKRILNNSWCHQCKVKSKKIVVCDNFWETNKEIKCNGRYCTKCSERHYGQKISELEKLEVWKCYGCTSVCVCAACRRLRNEDIPSNKKRKNETNEEEKKENRVKRKMTRELKALEEFSLNKRCIESKNIIEAKKIEEEDYYIRQENLQELEEDFESSFDDDDLPTPYHPSHTVSTIPSYHVSHSQPSMYTTANIYNKESLSSLDFLSEASLLQNALLQKGDSSSSSYLGLLSDLQSCMVDPNLEITRLKKDIEVLHSDIKDMKQRFANLQRMFHNALLKN